MASEISEHLFVGMNYDDSDRDIPEGDYRYALNLLTLNDEQSGNPRRQKVQGFKCSPASLPQSGELKCLGVAVDEGSGYIYYFVYHSLGSHMIIRYNSISDATQTVLLNGLLNFQENRNIKGAKVVSGKLLYWSDGFNPPMMINIDRAIQGKYNTGRETIVTFSQYKFHNPTPPSIASGYDASIDLNILSGNSFQFAYRYIYLDEEDSVVSSLTNNISVDVNVDIDNLNKNDNKITVSAPIPDEIKPILQGVEFIVRKSDDTTYYVFGKEDYVSGDTLSSDYFGSELVTPLSNTEQSRLFDFIPLKSEGLEIIKEQAFLVDSQTGYNVNEEDFSLSLSTSNAPISSSVVVVRQSSQTDFFNESQPASPTVEQEQLYPLSGMSYNVTENGLLNYKAEITWENLVDPSANLQIFLALTKNNSIEAEQLLLINNSGETVTLVADILVSPGDNINVQVVAKHGFHNNPIDWQLEVTDKSLTEAKSSTGEVACKYQGTYELGVIFYDQWGRPSSVSGAKKITIPQGGTKDGTDEGFIDIRDDVRKRIDVAFSGTPPDWARWYRLAVNGENTFNTYVQFPTYFYFFRRDYDEDYTLEADEVRIGGRVFSSDRSTDVTGNNEKIYLKMPINLGVLPDTDYYVRILIIRPFAPLRVEKVVAVRGEFIEVSGNFGRDNWDTFTTRDAILVEMYKPFRSDDGLFYEYDEIKEISNWGQPNRAFSGNITYNGDTYLIQTDGTNQFEYNRDEVIEGDLNYNDVKSKQASFESPSLNYGAAKIRQVENDEEETTSLVASVDYTKKAPNRGRTFIIDRNQKQRQFPTVVRYSDKFVQDSNVNGLSTFQLLNKYTLPIERGDITKLVQVDDVLLAFHTSSVSSMYIGESFIKATTGAESLVKTDGVIEDDRLLSSGRYGCKHPESIVVNQGRCYWYDILNGEVCRHSNDGINPIGTMYKMGTYFKEKSEQRLPYPNAKIYGGYDPYTEMYILTFDEVIDPGDGVTILHRAETVGYSDKWKRWVTFFSFVPEMYGALNNRMLLFKNGNLWKSRGVSLYNYFFEEAFGSEINFVHNLELPREKAIEAVYTSATERWNVEISTDEGQFTDIRKNEFGLRKELFYSEVKRDINTNPDLLNGKPALLYGNEMRSAIVKIRVFDSDLCSGDNFASELYSVMVMYRLLSDSGSRVIDPDTCTPVLPVNCEPLEEENGLDLNWEGGACEVMTP